MDLHNCLGDTDSLSCYVLPVDAAAVIVPGLTGVGRADNAIRAARGADDLGGGGRFIPPGGAGGGDDPLEKFVKERLGTAPQNINCYGCALKEWPEAQGKKPLVEGLLVNPWDKKGLDAFHNSRGSSDEIAEIIKNNFEPIKRQDLTPGALVSWYNGEKFYLPYFDIPEMYYYTTHVGIHYKNGLVFSKKGWKGPYTVEDIDVLSQTFGTPSFWRAK